MCILQQVFWPEWESRESLEKNASKGCSYLMATLFGIHVYENK